MGDGNLHGELDRRKRHLSKLSTPSFIPFSLSVVVAPLWRCWLNLEVGVTAGRGQGVWREWHFGISIVHYVQGRGHKERIRVVYRRVQTVASSP